MPHAHTVAAQPYGGCFLDVSGGLSTYRGGPAISLWSCVAKRTAEEEQPAFADEWSRFYKRCFVCRLEFHGTKMQLAGLGCVCVSEDTLQAQRPHGTRETCIHMYPYLACCEEGIPLNKVVMSVTKCYTAATRHSLHKQLHRQTNREHNTRLEFVMRLATLHLAPYLCRINSINAELFDVLHPPRSSQSPRS